MWETGASLFLLKFDEEDLYQLVKSVEAVDALSREAALEVEFPDVVDLLRLGAVGDEAGGDLDRELLEAFLNTTLAQNESARGPIHTCDRS